MPLLRRPHDRRRDVRGRLSAPPRPDHHDRYVMTVRPCICRSTEHRWRWPLHGCGGACPLERARRVLHRLRRSGRLLILGGNQSSGCVSIAPFGRERVVGYRMPVAPTVSALRAAGSTEIRKADLLQKVAAGGAVTEVAAQAAQAATQSAAPVVPAPIVPQIDPSLVNLSKSITVVQKIAEGTRAVSTLVLESRTLLVLAICAVAFAVGWWIKRRRRERHAQGQ